MTPEMLEQYLQVLKEVGAPVYAAAYQRALTGTIINLVVLTVLMIAALYVMWWGINISRKVLEEQKNQPTRNSWDKPARYYELEDMKNLGFGMLVGGGVLAILLFIVIAVNLKYLVAMDYTMLETLMRLFPK